MAKKNSMNSYQKRAQRRREDRLQGKEVDYYRVCKVFVQRIGGRMEDWKGKRWRRFPNRYVAIKRSLLR